MPPATRPSTRRLGILIVSIVLAAAMLRAPLVAVAPVARAVGADLGVSPAVVGLLTGIPVIAFAVCSPLAVAVIRRGGADFALSVSMAGAVVGCLVRSAGGVPAALVGTAIIGVFLTIGNVVVPVVIAREFPPHRVHMMTGVYTSAINIGTMSVTVATAPLASVAGWQGAIALPAMFGLAALATWAATHGVRGAFLPGGAAPSASADGDPSDVPEQQDAAGRRSSVLRAGTTWALGAAFAGQAFSYYAMTAWLPTLLIDHGFGSETAGAIAGVFQVAGIAGGLLAPVLTTRVSILAGVLAVAVGWITVPLGFMIAPDLWWVWCLVGGAAQGGGLTVVFIMVSALGGDQRDLAARSGVVQGVGYALAALGPTVIGGIHDATGGWTVPLWVVVVAVALFGAVGSGVALRLRRA
ncbi:MAG: MFS transporter [Microbacterium sp.]|uniref:MFS transporter n=1 Tax=Microbacterium sp. TaxID=51671 RepID=UPI0039E42177